MAAVWISKRDAIALVLAAQGPETLPGRSTARSALAKWVREGMVRTKETAERPRNCKYFRKVYRRADIVRRLAGRTGSARKWTADAEVDGRRGRAGRRAVRSRGRPTDAPDGDGGGRAATRQGARGSRRDPRAASMAPRTG